MSQQKHSSDCGVLIVGAEAVACATYLTDWRDYRLPVADFHQPVHVEYQHYAPTSPERAQGLAPADLAAGATFGAPVELGVKSSGQIDDDA